MILDKNSFLRNEAHRPLILATFTTLTIGSIFYHFVEGWKWLDSIYFSVITLTTVGYGDFSPQTDIGKIFTIFYVVLGIGLFLAFINSLYEHRKVQATPLNNEDPMKTKY